MKNVVSIILSVVDIVRVTPRCLHLATGHNPRSWECWRLIVHNCSLQRVALADRQPVLLYPQPAQGSPQPVIDMGIKGQPSCLKLGVTAIQFMLHLGRKSLWSVVWSALTAPGTLCSEQSCWAPGSHHQQFPSTPGLEQLPRWHPVICFWTPEL